MENAARARDRELKARCSLERLAALLIVREIRRLLEWRYGSSLPDDDAGRDDFALLANYVVQVNTRDPIGAVVRDARHLAPWLGDEAARRVAEAALLKPLRLRADTLAQRLGVTYALRTALRFTRIGAADLTRAERNQAVRKRRTAVQRDKRRRAGMMPRQQYRAAAEALRAEAQALGISVDALRKRRQRAEMSKVCDERRRVLDPAVHALRTSHQGEGQCLSHGQDLTPAGPSHHKPEEGLHLPHGRERHPAPTRRAKNYGSVARKAATSIRIDVLSSAHHQIVAPPEAAAIVAWWQDHVTPGQRPGRKGRKSISDQKSIYPVDKAEKQLGLSAVQVSRWNTRTKTRVGARWRLGQLLAKVERAKHPGKGKVTLGGLTSLLKDVGLTKFAALHAQRIAALPEAEVEKALAAALMWAPTKWNASVPFDDAEALALSRKMWGNDGNRARPWNVKPALHLATTAPPGRTVRVPTLSMGGAL